MEKGSRLLSLIPRLSNTGNLFGVAPVYQPDCSNDPQRRRALSVLMSCYWNVDCRLELYGKFSLFHGANTERRGEARESQTLASAK